MAETAKKGGFIGTLLGIIVLLVIGIAIGVSPAGDVVKSIYYSLRYLNMPIAQGFLPKPYSMHIAYAATPQKQVEVYLVNEAKNEMLPIYEVEGTTQVGDVAHRVKGLGEETRTKVMQMVEDAKKGSSTALDRLGDLLERLGK